jgi:hypothetical protein
MTNGGTDPTRFKIYQLHTYRLALLFTPELAIRSMEAPAGTVYLEDLDRPFKRASSDVDDSEKNERSSKKKKEEPEPVAGPSTRSRSSTEKTVIQDVLMADSE